MEQTIKVAKVIDDFTVVINIGSKDDIKLGQKFLIYEVSDEEILDPDTKESLGYLEIVKGTGKVTHVQFKLSTLESCMYESSPIKTVQKNPLFGALSEYTEITENDKTQLPFKEVCVGDFAKRVN